MLGQLLRKKLEPHIEDYVEQGRATATPLSTQPNNPTRNNPTINPNLAPPASGDGAGLGLTELEELWDWAGLAANEEARKRLGLGDFTLEEREAGIENVVTGLKRKLGEDTSSGETSSGEDEEMDEGEPKEENEVVGAKNKEVSEVERQPPEVKGPQLPLDDILRFMSTGAEPKEPSSQAPLPVRR